ncbi:helix-turn-helix domain-containing protein [Streptomyces sp. PT12]|uniref:helix-turn-helix domain-containing protein n=1 Tax=Streptomyces sp. PT12 TaxID=1510197 RepID=UPI000DE5489F|nr:helix-turn-helix transcriptional regulator [Streptomyces sp. PT12]RBM07367.1 transcriptional regulator [Streptomyces sp. PT12]
MPHQTDDHTGARVKRARKTRGLTQRELADIAPVSYSTITKIEQGLMAASPAVLGALARALSVPVTELTGQPYLEDLRRDQLDGLIQPIRDALDLYDLGADPLVTPRPVEQLANAADSLCALVRATDLRGAAAALPGLIEEATTAAWAAPSSEAWRVLASTYRTAYDVSSKLGYLDLCTVALDRMEWAAQRGSAPAVSAIRQYMRALVYMRGAEYRTGGRLLDAGLAALEQADRGRERDVVTGQLHLGAAVLTARAQDAAAADAHIAEAQQIADATGAAERVHWLAFGPTNVAIHRVAALSERDDYDRAVLAADGITFPEDWPRSRTAHHHAEVARAQLWTGRIDDAFRSLQAARRAGPQQTKYHPMVRETYAGLDAAKRQLPHEFVSFGAWLGM